MILSPWASVFNSYPDVFLYHYKLSLEGESTFLEFEICARGYKMSTSELNELLVELLAKRKATRRALKAGASLAKKTKKAEKAAPAPESKKEIKEDKKNKEVKKESKKETKSETKPKEKKEPTVKEPQDSDANLHAKIKELEAKISAQEKSKKHTQEKSKKSGIPRAKNKLRYTDDSEDE